MIKSGIVLVDNGKKMQSMSSAVLIKSDSDPLPHHHGFIDEDDDEDSLETQQRGSAATTKKKAAGVRKMRRVSFPVDDQLITGYVEPPDPWEKAIGVTTPEVVAAYVKACLRYNIIPLSSVIEQLQMINRFDERVDCLDLHGEKLNCSHMEALEEVFKRVRFITINLENTCLDDESSLPLFDMMEYYDSVKVLNISRNKNISMQGWQACCRMIKRTHSLEELIACGIPLEEENIRVLQRTLKVNPNLAILRLDNCGISGRQLATLMNGLKPNKVLRELHLAGNKMSCMDGIQVAQLLRSNLQLRLLNLSGNQLEDQGISHLAEGLGDQNQLQVMLKTNYNRRGLRSLVLRDNKMTSNSVASLSKALIENKSLEILDLGGNDINNEGIYTLKETLMRNRTLLQLKLNDCRITCEGAVALAEYVAENPKIQELDLRDNCIRLGGLLALAQSMKVNQSVTKLELDTPKGKETPADEEEQRRQLLLQVSEYSDRNWDMLEKKREIEAAEEGCEVQGHEEDVEEIYSEPVSKLLSLWSNAPSLRPSSVTCHPPIAVPSVADSLPEPGGWQSVRGMSYYHHYLRSPQPSPSSSPIPSPTRNRFHVTRVFQEVDSSSTSATVIRPNPVSSSATSVASATIANRVKFIVTPVIDAISEEPIHSPIVSSSSSSTPDEQKCDGDESSDNDSVFLDQPEIGSSFPSPSVTMELEEDKLEMKEEEEDVNGNGDRDSGIYLLDLNGDDVYGNSTILTAVPAESEHTLNNELIDRLLQDSSAAASEGIMTTLVDVCGSYPWTEPPPNSEVELRPAGIDFLTDGELCNGWVSPANMTGDLITFTESVEPVELWLGRGSEELGDVTSISTGNIDSSGSFDGGESNGSSDSGVTESLEGDFSLQDDACAASALLPVVTVIEKTFVSASEDESDSRRDAQVDGPQLKVQNGYCTISSLKAEGGNDGKRSRTPGCAGSKDVSSHWTA